MLTTASFADGGRVDNGRIMAESPGPTRKPYFPNPADLAGYNRQLAESLSGITDPNEFGSFTLFPEGDKRPQHEPSGLVWQDLSSLASAPPPPTSSSLSCGDFSAAAPFVPSYEDYLSRSGPEYSPPVNPLPTGNYPTHNGYSPNYVDEPDFTHGLGLGDANQQGYELYSKSLEDWSNFSTYSPFGTSEGPVAYIPTSDKDCSNKPSYSEVARSLRAKSGKSGKADTELGKKKSDVLIKHQRQIKKNFSKPHPHSKGKTGVTETPSLPVHPDSKYGLDQFEEPVIPRKNSSSCSGSFPEKTSSAESLPQLSRQESTSSISSTGSAGDEVIVKVKPAIMSSSPVMSAKPVPKDLSPSPPTLDLVNHAKEKECKPGPTFPTEKVSNRSSAGEGSKGAAKPFFDPKRIFQSKAYNSATTSKKSTSGTTSTAGNTNTTVLNNGKLSYSSKAASTVHRRSSDYINNDLRDTKKKSSNQGCSRKEHDGVEKNVKDESCSGKYFHKHDKSKSLYNRQLPKVKSQNVCKDNFTSVPNIDDDDRGSPSRGPNIDQEIIDEWLSYWQEKARWLCQHTWRLLITLVVLLISLIAFMVSGLSYLVAKVGNKTWDFIRAKLFRHSYENGSGFKMGDSRQRLGLEEKITLPTTGEEAMQRLLACKGKDPYSILGLNYEATDEEIKKYYKRQAVLVHPDKNQQPGAEEAFKILGHAFELIGEPDKRKHYDSQVHEANEAETAMQEFADLLTKLQEKIQEAANMMRCDNCGGKHRRLPVKRPWYSARFCDRCSQRHSAKEGDVWAESSMLGFLWHYYACMEGKVFDITEWVACRKEFFKHMQANAHHVFYRIATEGNRSHQHGRSGENDLEDFINHLFHRAMNTEGTETSQWGQQKQGSTNSGQANWNSKDANVRRKRKKKKH